MRVGVYETVEIETEVEVSVDDIIGEFRKRVEESSKDYFRGVAPALDAITRILADVKDEVIAEFPESACKTLYDRLMTEAARWKRD